MVIFQRELYFQSKDQQSKDQTLFRDAKQIIENLQAVIFSLKLLGVRHIKLIQ
jgi:hypothetical protein